MCVAQRGPQCLDVGREGLHSRNLEESRTAVLPSARHIDMHPYFEHFLDELHIKITCENCYGHAVVYIPTFTYSFGSECGVDGGNDFGDEDRSITHALHLRSNAWLNL